MNTTLFFKRAICSALLIGSFSQAQADVQVTLDEPDWSFSYRQSKGAHHSGRVNRDEGKFFNDVQPLLQKQDYKGVIQAYDTYQQEHESVSATLHEMMGQVFLSVKRNIDAKKHFELALTEDAASATSHRGLSMIYMLEESYPKARDHVVKAIELGVTDSQVYGQLGYLNLQLEKPRSAIGAYQNAMMLEPANGQWAQGLLFALIASDALPQASALVSEMLSEKPDSPRLWLQRSQIAMKGQDDLTAISSLETALTLGEKRPDNLTTLAKLHVKSGSPNRAVDLLSDNAATLLASNNDGAQTMLDIANWLAASQDWKNLSGLVTTLDKNSKRLSSENVASLNVMKANLAISNNQTSKAQDYLLSAIKSSPANGDALMTLAALLRKQNKDENAKMYYLRAEALPAYKERAMLGRAQVAINQKQYNDALGLLRQVYKSNPGRNDLLSNIQSLENIVKNAS